LHRLSTSFVLGYHGCDKDVGNRLLAGTPFEASANEHDWLGAGVYFWEANPLRGLEFARELQVRRAGKANAIREPFVVGAVIDLGFCLDLTSSNGTRAVAAVYADLQRLLEKSNTPIPENTKGSDLLLRKLDCAVINHLHAVREESGLEEFQTVKGVFIEGDRIYPGAGFRHKTHIQLCVRDQACIKGVFRVPAEHLQS
jgi:hypothetical protein